MQVTSVCAHAWGLTAAGCTLAPGDPSAETLGLSDPGTESQAEGEGLSLALFLSY